VGVAVIMRWWRRLSPQNHASILLFVGVLIVYIYCANRSLTYFSNDIIYIVRPAWTLGTGGSLNIEQFPDFTTIANWSFQYDGHTRSDRFPGAILLSALFYGVARPDDFTIVPAAVAAAFASAVTVLALHRVLLALVRPRTALAGALLFAFGTSVWTVAADGIWTEGPTMMGIALATWAMSKQSWLLAGLGYGFAIMSRPHAAVFAAVTGLWAGVSQRSIIPVLKVAATSGLGLALLLVYVRINSGQWDIFQGTYGGRIDASTTTDSFAGGQANTAQWISDYAATFFSPLRGVFAYSPFLLLALPGLIRAWRVAPHWVKSTAVSGVVYLVIQLQGNTWFGGGGIYGYRLILPSLLAWWPLLTIAFEQWTEKAKWSRYGFYGLAGVSVWWFAPGALIFRQNYIDANVSQFTEWWSWHPSLYVRWAGPFGWAAAAVFVAALVYFISLVPGGDPSAPPAKKGKAKQAGAGKTVKGEPAPENEPVAVAAEPKAKSGSGAAVKQGTAEPPSSAKKSPGGPNANKKRR